MTMAQACVEAGLRITLATAIEQGQVGKDQ